MQKEQSNFIAIDIGSYSISALVVNIDSNFKFKIIHSAIFASDGFNLGLVKDFDRAQNTISKILYSLEKVISTTIEKVLVCFSSNDIQSNYYSHNIEIESSIVKKTDINLLMLDVVDNFNIINRTILHCFPVNFSVDQYNNLQNPVGMIGKKLNCNLHIVSVDNISLQSIINCFAKCNVQIEEFAISSISQCFTLLHPEEKIKNTLIIDLGESSTSFSVIENNIPIFSDSIPLGGFHITNDLTYVLSLDFNIAEKIKILHSNINSNDSITINLSKLTDSKKELNKQDKSLDNKLVNNIIKSRLEEILYLVKEKVDQSNTFVSNKKAIVISGGSSLIKGIKSLCAQIFDVSFIENISEYYEKQKIKVNGDLNLYSTSISSIFYKLSNMKNYDFKEKNTILAIIKRFFFKK